MDKLEKVKKGLECCYASFPKCKACPVCPYDKICYHDKACNELLKDALELLKEKQPIKVNHVRYVADLFIGECPSCGEGLNNEVYPRFCGFCGQPITWNVGDGE